MKRIKLLFLTCLTAFLFGLIPGGTAWADDGGGDDGGGDFGDDGGGDFGDDGGHDGDWDHDGHHDHDRHHHHIVDYWGWPGWGWGPGFGYGGFGAFGLYAPPYYTYPRVAVQPAPPVYIQQNPGQFAPETQNNNWHYCRASEAYYPQVQECPDGWLQVPPQAQNNNPDPENPM